MTPLQFAKEQCANYQGDGGCAGIGINDDGSTFMFGRKPACVLSLKQRCKYFEECVLPMHIEPCNAVNIARAKEKEEAVRLYSHDAPRIARASGRLCPQCRKREVEPPKRLCYSCAESNQKKANRGRKAKEGPTST